MRYFIIAGEASGDLHASHLVSEIKKQDAAAQFQGLGGDLMAAAGVDLLWHYQTMAYMGFVQVILHLPQILRAMRACKQAISSYHPDAIILVDYPGFNLNIAAWVKKHLNLPIYYYIAPKIWAWKEGRIRKIRSNVDKVLSILPFEVDYFARKHHYTVDYVGNPSRAEVDDFLQHDTTSFAQFCATHHLDPQRKIIALLAGSRRSEIAANLPRMLQAFAQVQTATSEISTTSEASASSTSVPTFQAVIAAAPGIPLEEYAPYLQQHPHVHLVSAATYPLLKHAYAALVTSGTATLETALFGVPQVVCYHLKGGALIRAIQPHFLNCRFISLVNLIADEAVVPELIADHTHPQHIARHLLPLLDEKSDARQAQLSGYARVRAQLGTNLAPTEGAQRIVQHLRQTRCHHT